MSDQTNPRDKGETLRFEGQAGLRLAASGFGPRSGMKVLLCHGGGQTRHAWGGTAAMLGLHGFRAITLDLRGHGQSDWSHTGDYALGSFANDVRLVASQLGGDPIIAVGASLGGMSVLLAAGDPPFMPLHALVLVDITPDLHADGVDAIRAFMLGTRDGFESLDEAAQAIARYLPHRPTRNSAAGLNKNLRQRSDGRYYWHWDPDAIDKPDAGIDSREAMLRAARQIVAPTVLLRGGESELVSAESAAHFIEHFRDGRTVDIPGARHMVAGDRNDRFSDELLRFAIDVRADHVRTLRLYCDSLD